MPDFIEVYDNAFPHEHCEIFIDVINTSSKSRQTRKSKCGKELLKDVWYVDHVSMDEPSIHTISLVDVINECKNKYVEKHHQLKRTDASWEIDPSFNLQKYDPNMGYYVSHTENAGRGIISTRRMLVWMIYLNTVTDGGGTYFENYDKTLDAVEGRCVIWPAFWTHFHNGIVSKTQTKYIATGWFMYDKWAHLNKYN